MFYLCYNNFLNNKLYGVLLINEAIKYELEQLNISVTISTFINAVKEAQKDDIIFTTTSYLGYPNKMWHEFEEIQRKEIKLYVFNIEEIVNNLKWRNRLNNLLTSEIPHAVLDTFVHRLNFIQNKNKFLFQPGYSPYLENLIEKSNEEKTIDVLLYGNKNARRTSLIKRIKRNRIPNIVFEKSFENEEQQKSMIQKSKIVLDTYFYDVSGIDFFRCSLLASNKVFFIHETILEEEQDSDFLNVMVHANHEEIPAKCKEWLRKSQEERDAKAEEVYEFFKKKYNIGNQLKNLLC